MALFHKAVLYYEDLQTETDLRSALRGLLRYLSDFTIVGAKEKEKEAEAVGSIFGTLAEKIGPGSDSADKPHHPQHPPTPTASTLPNPSVSS